MERAPASLAVRDPGFWLQALSLAVSVTVTVLWMAGADLPVANYSELILFYHAVPGYSVVLAGLLATALFEPLGDFAPRIYLLAGACLLTLTSTVGVLNAVSIEQLGVSALVVSVLCLLESALLTAAVCHRECSRDMERVDNYTDRDRQSTS